MASTPVFLGTPSEIGEIEPLDLLVIAPHPDDAELGMGGTIAKMIDEGFRIGVLDLTSGEPTPHGSEATRRSETSVATDVLKLTWRGNAGLVNRELQHTLEARALLASYFRMLRPRWLFAPYWEDAHPDHVVATELIEAITARFKTPLRSPEPPWTRGASSPSHAAVWRRRI